VKSDFNGDLGMKIVLKVICKGILGLKCDY
jgi:hypothetical protein